MSILFFLMCFLVSGTTVLPDPQACEKIPALNQQILLHVKSAIGKKVADGECWSLAAMALDKAHARWDHQYIFGKKLNLAGECFAPGDIIQFENVVMEHQSGSRIYRDEATHHTAIIFAVKSDGEITLAEQNTSKLGMKTGFGSFRFSWVKQGTCTVFRPQQ